MTPKALQTLEGLNVQTIVASGVEPHAVTCHNGVPTGPKRNQTARQQMSVFHMMVVSKKCTPNSGKGIQTTTHHLEQNRRFTTRGTATPSADDVSPKPAKNEMLPKYQVQKQACKMEPTTKLSRTSICTFPHRLHARKPQCLPRGTYGHFWPWPDRPC